MSVYELTEMRDFDCVASHIHCRADREGAQVFEVQSGNVLVRVLAHTDLDAHEAAEAYAAQWMDGNA